MKKIRQLWRYVQVKLIIAVAIIILPFNVVTIIQNWQSREILLRLAQMNFQNILDNYMNSLNDKMNNASEQLFQFVLYDQNLIRMRMQNEKNYEYQSAKMKFIFTLSMIGQMSYGLDGYFYYFTNLNDILAHSSENSMIRKRMEEYIPDLQKRSGCRGWHIYEVDGKRYLILMMEKSSVIFGGWIDLESEVVQLKDRISYDKFDIFFSEEEAHADSDKKLLIISSIHDIYLTLAVPNNEILGSLSWIQKSMRLMVFVSFSLIPILYIVIKKYSFFH